MTLTSVNEVKVRTRLPQFWCPPHLPPEEWQVDVRDIPSLVTVQAGLVELDVDSLLDLSVRIPGFLVQNLHIVHNRSVRVREPGNLRSRLNRTKGGGGGGRNSQIKRTGVLVVPFRG